MKYQTEKEITASIRSLLRNLNIWHWKNIGALGMPRGLPDIIGVWKDGQILAIEVKTPRGVASDEQKRFIEMINQSGGLAFVARSVDDVIDNLGIRDRFLF